MYYPENNNNRVPEQPAPPQGPVPPNPPVPPQAPKPPKRRRLGWLKITALCLCCALLGGAAGLGGGWLAANRMRPEAQAVTPPAQQPQQATTPDFDSIPSATELPEGQLSPGQVYALNVNACVGITVSTTTNIYGYKTTSAATGSGFVLTEDGYIITNHHVIEKAAKNTSVPITVSFQNGTSYTATLVGSEPDNDVALLKIQATGLQAVVLGDSSKLVVGEPVYAIGNPLGELTYTLTDGLVSALDRVITTGSGNDATSMNMLQTNCAINPGNSGGPLFNGRGEVVGITTAKMSSSGSQASVEGLGFAVPINDVKPIVNDLMEHGRITGKPYLGVTVTSVTETDAKRYNLPVGAYVESVEPGSCAEKAGLKVGDIVVAMDDTVITTHSALIATKATYRAGDTVVLKVVRNQQELELTVVLDEEPVQAAQPNSGSQTPSAGDKGGSGYSGFPWEEFGSIFGFPFNGLF